MPYDTNQDLPDSVKNVLPEHAQNIFREAFDIAYEQYDDPEDRRVVTTVARRWPIRLRGRL